MQARRRIVALLVVAVAAATAPLAVATSRHASSVATVKVAYSKALKTKILVDARGLTLYMYTADYAGHPMCTNDPAYHCSKAWPPLRSTGKPRAGAGVKPSLLTTAKRSDGASQVQYRGHPLYTDVGSVGFGLKGDKKPGDVNGQGFASSWYVLSPTGKPIKKSVP